MTNNRDPRFREPSESKTRSQHLRDTAGDVAAAIEILMNHGLHASQFSHGLQDRMPTIWIDAPGADHPVRGNAVVYAELPDEPDGRRQVAYCALICSCRVKWIEHELPRGVKRRYVNPHAAEVG